MFLATYGKSLGWMLHSGAHVISALLVIGAILAARFSHFGRGAIIIAAILSIFAYLTPFAHSEITHFMETGSLRKRWDLSASMMLGIGASIISGNAPIIALLAAALASPEAIATMRKTTPRV
jgi:hypothetical protein